MNKTKFISAALLLAAGTALSNAAIALTDAVLGWDSFAGTTPNINTCSANIDLNGATVSDGKLTTSGTAPVKLTTTGSFSTVASNRSTFTAIMTIDVSSLLAQSATTAIFTISTGAASAADLGFGIDASRKLVGYWSNGGYDSFNVGSSVWNTNKYVKDGKLTIAFKQMAGESGTRIALVDQTKTAENKVDYWTNKGLKSYSVALTTISLGGDQTAGTNAGAITFDQFYLFNSALSEADIQTAIGLMQSVPEPSAFGLLAGLGALALVASRRRRSRKAA